MDYPRFVTDSQGPLIIYEEPVDGQEYVLGVDTAEGKVRDRNAGPIATGDNRNPDFNAVSVVRVSDWKECATYLSNYAPPLFLKDVLAIACLYGKMSGLEPPLIVPEINGPGIAIVEGLREQGYPAIWRQQVFLHIEQRMVEQIGWRTDQRSRPMMLTELQRAILNGTAGISCPRTAKHAQAMRYGNDGVARAQGSQKDDLAIAYMLALQGILAIIQDGKKRPTPGTPEDPIAEPPDPWQHRAAKLLDYDIREATPEELRDQLDSIEAPW